MEAASRPIALTIAGSDSGGGAGIQADLRTFATYGCYGTSVVTAITAQDTRGVRAVHPVPAAIVREQLDAIADDLPPEACKTGMLGNREIVEVVAAGIGAHRWPHYVLDPVIRSTSGTVLLDTGGVAALRSVLLPLAECVTPNLDELEELTGVTARDPDAMVRGAEALRMLGARSALVTGGHLAGDVIVDVLVSKEGTRRFEHPRIAATSTHGTGCVLSAAIAAGLARGAPLDVAVEEAIDHVRGVLASTPAMGASRAGAPPARSTAPAGSEDDGAM